MDNYFWVVRIALVFVLFNCFSTFPCLKKHCFHKRKCHFSEGITDFCKESVKPQSTFKFVNQSCICTNFCVNNWELLGIIWEPYLRASWGWKRFHTWTKASMGVVTNTRSPTRAERECIYSPVFLFQSQRCLSCSMLQVLPFVRVDNLEVINSKEKATPQDISAAFLAYLDLRVPREPTGHLGTTAASAFQAEMVETAGKEKRERRELQVMMTKLHKALLPRPHFMAAPSLLLCLARSPPLVPSGFCLHRSLQFTETLLCASDTALTLPESSHNYDNSVCGCPLSPCSDETAKLEC